MSAKMECPYDKSHMIEPLRMPGHLLRCRKNHPYVDMAVCPFNATHEMQKPELRYHMSHCPDRTVLENQFSLRMMLSDRPEGQSKGCTDLPSLNNRRPDSDIVDDEWDREMEQSPFSLFNNEPELSTEEEIPTTNRKWRESNIDRELRRPLTLSKAASLSQGRKSERIPATAHLCSRVSEESEIPDTTSPERVARIPLAEDPRVPAVTSRIPGAPSVYSLLALGRGRARSVTSTEVTGRPGLSQSVSPLVSPSISNSPKSPSSNIHSEVNIVQCASCVAPSPHNLGRGRGIFAFIGQKSRNS